MKLPHRVEGVPEVRESLPKVVRFGVSDPLNEILESAFIARGTYVEYPFNFVLWFVVDEVGWRVRVVQTVSFGFDVWDEERGVEDGVDPFPSFVEIETIIDGADLFEYGERSMSLSGQLSFRSNCTQILAV